MEAYVALPVGGVQLELWAMAMFVYDRDKHRARGSKKLNQTSSIWIGIADFIQFIKHPRVRANRHHQFIIMVV